LLELGEIAAVPARRAKPKKGPPNSKKANITPSASDEKGGPALLKRKKKKKKIRGKNHEVPILKN